MHNPWWMDVLLASHVVSGVAAFVLAPLALITAKGGKAHRRWVLFLVHGRRGLHGAGDGSLAASSVSRLGRHLQFLRGFRSVPCARAKGRIGGETGRPRAGLVGGHPVPRRECCSCGAGSGPAATGPKPQDSIHRFWIGRCAHFRGSDTALHPSAHGQDVLVVRASAGHDRQLYCSVHCLLPCHSWPASAWRLVAVAASDIDRNAGHSCHKSLLSAAVSFKAGCAAGLEPLRIRFVVANRTAPIDRFRARCRKPDNDPSVGGKSLLRSPGF